MRRTVLPVLIAAAVSAAIIGLPAGADPAPPAPARALAAPADQPCAQPYQPWFFDTTYPATKPAPDLGTEISYQPGKPDTDGDGTPDTFGSVGTTSKPYQAVTITRGSGTLKLTPGSGNTYIYFNDPQGRIGDLDGDGRDEIIVGVDQQGATYLVPGTTPDGTHSLTSAGIDLDGYSNVPRAVGDQNGHGKGDVAFRTGDGFSVISGADLLAPGPGGAAGTITPIATLSGTNLDAAPLTPGADPTLITGVPTLGGIAVTVHTTPAVELSAPGATLDYTNGIGAITTHRRDGEVLVSVTGTDRSGGTISVWNLTNPCSRYVPTSGPAGPVSGDATYTG